ncbi:hypothetical protein NDN08_004321 [Rhodosorus marinus]|uniref:60S acidic ribosomal protein P1 n=1 Tax=Rhodosorus marinus TaxID=101924 RepID=A0AAV8UP16_9RHOD|nr:hypothetical protein NDN08_004321 [Rhodosorus marinus]
MPAASEAACVYAALILHDDGVEISSDNINSLVKAAGVEVEPYWPSLFSKLLEKVTVGDLISGMTAAPVVAAAPVAGAPAAAAAAGGGDAPAAADEAAKEEEEEDEDMGMDMFGGEDDY